MLMKLIMSRSQAELKPFSCVKVQDHLRFIDFTTERDVYMRFSVHMFSLNHMYTYLRN